MSEGDCRDRILGMLRQDKERAYRGWLQAAVGQEAVRARVQAALRLDPDSKHDLGLGVSPEVAIREAEWRVNHALLKLQATSEVLEYAERKLV